MTPSKFSKDDSSRVDDPKLTAEERDLAKRLVGDPRDTKARSEFYKMSRFAQIRRSAGAPK
jgi:hypothetical protein